MKIHLNVKVAYNTNCLHNFIYKTSRFKQCSYDLKANCESNYARKQYSDFVLSLLE